MLIKVKSLQKSGYNCVVAWLYIVHKQRDYFSLFKTLDENHTH